MSQRKRVRKELSLSGKIKLIKEAEGNPYPRQEQLANKYGIGRSTVADILKKKDNLLKKKENSFNLKRKRVGKDSKFIEINDFMFL